MWIEIKTINGHQYRYERWRDYIGETVIKRSRYLGKVQDGMPTVDMMGG